MAKLLSITIIGIALIFIVCCGERANNQLHADQLHPDEIAIYLELARSGPSREIRISSDAIHAIGMTRPEDVRTVLPSAPEAISVAFLLKNQENLISKKEDVPLGDGFVLMGSNDLKERLSGLYRHSSFSRVGFDPTGKTAIVWYADVCAPICSEAGLYLLEYNSGKWVIRAESEKFHS